MDGPSFLLFYALTLVGLLLVSWVVRAIAGDVFQIRLLFALTFLSVGLARYFTTSSEMHNWWIMAFGMIFGTFLFFLKADNVSVSSGGSSGGCGGSSGGSSGGDGGGDGGGCGGGGCGGCGD